MHFRKITLLGKKSNNYHINFISALSKLTTGSSIKEDNKRKKDYWPFW